MPWTLNIEAPLPFNYNARKKILTLEYIFLTCMPCKSNIDAPLPFNYNARKKILSIFFDLYALEIKYR